MTAALPEIEVGESGLASRRSRIPGMAAIRATSGFQRGMLFAGLFIVAFFIVLAVFAPLLAPYSFDAASAHGKDFVTLQSPSSAHLFGTTVSGTDVLSRCIYGAQTALEVIVLAVLLSIVVGVPVMMPVAGSMLSPTGSVGETE